ncbi:MAG: winged helix-turn-helix domain-containing protein [Candidatus Bipolaricaulaceae bacterium]
MGVADVGEAAGRVWRFLTEQGPCSLSQVIRQVEGPERLVLMALGWLAREAKLELHSEERRTVVSLRA